MNEKDRDIGPSAPGTASAATPCAVCVAYRRGHRENVVYLGITVHVCERKRDGSWGFEDCPCGCVMREPGQIDVDRVTYGNAFLGSRGERIDPTTVRAA